MELSDAVLGVSGLLLLAVIIAGLGRRLPVPFTVLLVIIGALLGEAAKTITWLSPLTHFRLSPELVFFIFLPALVFESALNLDARQLRRDLAPVLVLAVPALLMSTCIVGFGVAWIADLPLGVGLLFGALISATDPVAVVALFKELGAPARLMVLVEGESLFNDATAIVVFSILLGLVINDDVVDTGMLLWAGWEFLRVFLGGVLVGGVLGLVISEIGTRLRSSIPALILLSLIMAYTSFVIGEHVFHVSGVMAAMTAALVLGGIGLSKMPLNAGQAIRESWEVLALIGNALLFLLVGMSMDTLALLADLETILGIVLLMLLARAAAVYGLAPGLGKLMNMPKISTQDRHIMWWGGLKGGLAIAIVLSIPDSLAAKPLLVNLTVGVVLFTLLVNAPSIHPLMKYLGMDRLNPWEVQSLGQAISQARDESSGLLHRLHDNGLMSRSALHSAEDRITGQVADDLVEKSETGSQALRAQAMGEEGKELERLRADHLISQYVYLDLRTDLQHREEQNQNAYQQSNAATDGPVVDAIGSPFSRFESAVIRRLRERNWAAALLARYQQHRLHQHLKRAMALLLMTRRAADYVHSREGDDRAQALGREYGHRIDQLTARISELREDFPAIYSSLETGLLPHVALNLAQRSAESRFEHGELGVKVFNRLARVLEQANEKLPESPSKHNVDLIGQLGKLPLFAGLPEAALASLARHGSELNYLPGDIIIGEGEHGDALYLLRSGSIAVSKGGEHLATMETEAIFGEMALLGDSTRSATVTATESCTLLRLTRRDVLGVAKNYPTLDQRLHTTERDHGG